MLSIELFGSVGKGFWFLSRNLFKGIKPTNKSTPFDGYQNDSTLVFVVGN